MVSSSIINKRYNSNEVNYTSENKYICYAELFFQLHYTSRFSTQLEDTILKKSSLCYALLRSLINRVALTDFVPCLLSILRMVMTIKSSESICNIIMKSLSLIKF